MSLALLPLLALPLFAQVSDTPREDPDRAQLIEDLRRAREEYAKDPHKYDVKPPPKRKRLEDLAADWEIVRVDVDKLGGLALWVRPADQQGGGQRVYRPDGKTLAKTAAQRLDPKELEGETFEARYDDDAWNAVDYAVTAARYQRALGKKYVPPEPEDVMIFVAGDMARGREVDPSFVDLRTLRAAFEGALDKNGELSADWFEGLEKTVASMNDTARKDDGFKRKLRVRRRPDLKTTPGYFELYDADADKVVQAYNVVGGPLIMMTVKPAWEKKEKK